MSLQEQISTYKRNNDAIDELLINHVKGLFQDSDIQTYYSLIKDVTLTDDRAKVIKAWLALLNGDNLTLGLLAKQIDQSQLSPEYQGFYMDLYALSGAFKSPEERLKMNDQAIDLLDNTSPFFLANAYLTRGQLLSGFERFREAQKAFDNSYELFLQEGCLFPAVTAQTNRLLNLFRLGEFSEIQTIYDKTLIMSSVQHKKQQYYWDILSLPMGMVLSQQGHFRASIEMLNTAYKAINQLGLVHMHGYVEIYLLHNYAITKHDVLCERLYTQSHNQFEHMKYPMMQAILLYGKYLTDRSLTLAEKEKLEVMNKSSGHNNPLIFELATMKDIIVDQDYKYIAELKEQITHYRYTGDVVALSQSLCFLAEYYMVQKHTKECHTTCQEIITLYHDYGIILPLHKYDYHFLKEIKSLDDRLPVALAPEIELTEKECEVLSLIEQGKTNKDIAETLFITVGTVKWHCNNIYQKLDVKSRVQAVNKAKELNII